MEHARVAGRTILVVATVLSLLDPILSLDHAVQERVQASRTPAADTLMRGASRLGNPATVLGALLAIAIVGGPAGVPTARAMIAVLVPVNVAVELTKAASRRVRPDGSADPRNSSFPSSHAANAAALAFALARRWRRGLPLFVILATVVSYSRIYLNRHFLSDVLGAAIIGLVIAWLVLDRLRGTAWSWESRRVRDVGGTPSLC
jgi:membrane-associated phospholipid phosphatase